MVPRFVHDAVHRGGITIDGDGEQRRYVSFITPVVTPELRLLQSVVGRTAPTPFVDALRSCVDYELADERSKETSLRSGVASVAS